MMMSAEIPRLTKEQAAIIGAFTGYCVGPFGDIQEYAERKLARSIWTHEFGAKSLSEELRAACRDDLLSIVHQEPGRPPLSEGE
jgi:hypothetical protein